MPFTNIVLFPSSPDPVVPSVIVPGLMDEDGLPGSRTLFAVHRSASFMRAWEGFRGLFRRRSAWAC